MPINKNKFYFSELIVSVFIADNIVGFATQQLIVQLETRAIKNMHT